MIVLCSRMCTVLSCSFQVLFMHPQLGHQQTKLKDRVRTGSSLLVCSAHAVWHRIHDYIFVPPVAHGAQLRLALAPFVRLDKGRVEFLSGQSWFAQQPGNASFLGEYHLAMTMVGSVPLHHQINRVAHGVTTCCKQQPVQQLLLSASTACHKKLSQWKLSSPCS